MATKPDPGAPRASTLPVLQAPPLMRRMAAWLYEGVLLFGVVVLAGLAFSIATQMRHALAHRQGLIVVLAIAIGIYCVAFWVRGQTLAMKTWHIRIVDRHGRRLRPGRAVLRYLFCYIWLLPPLAAFGTRQVAMGPLLVIVAGWVTIWALLSRLHPERQFWHDVLAGTRLVDDPTP